MEDTHGPVSLAPRPAGHAAAGRRRHRPGGRAGTQALTLVAVGAAVGVAAWLFLGLHPGQTEFWVSLAMLAIFLAGGAVRAPSRDA